MKTRQDIEALFRQLLRQAKYCGEREYANQNPPTNPSPELLELNELKARGAAKEYNSQYEFAMGVVDKWLLDNFNEGFQHAKADDNIIDITPKRAS